MAEAEKAWRQKAAIQSPLAGRHLYYIGITDYKSRLREEVEKVIKELEEMELSEFGKGRKRELITTLELIDSLRP
jgi:hypothetical protein